MTYTKRKYVTRRIEFGIPAGATPGVVNEVLAIAYRDYCLRTGADWVTADGGWAQIRPGDGETVVAYTVEYEATTRADVEVERLTDAVDRQAAQIREVLDLVERADRDGWDVVLAESGDDIGQAIGRILKT